MSIRTRSGNIVRRVDDPVGHSVPAVRGDVPFLRPKQWLAGWRGALCSALVVLLLVSCSQGDAKDERKFEMQEAEKTEQVPLAQQTELAQTFLQPTGTPVATFTPIALLSEIVIATGLDSSGGPSNDVESVSAGSGQFYLAGRLANLSGGETITMQLTDADGGVLGSQDVQANPSAGPQWYTSVWSASGVAPGTYAGAVLVNGQMMNSIVFTIR